MKKLTEQFKNDKKLFESKQVNESLQDTINTKILDAVKTAIQNNRNPEEALDKIKDEIFNNMTEEEYESYEDSCDASKDHELSIEIQNLIEDYENK